MKEQEIRKILARKLREFRLAANLTTKEVGAKIGKNEKTVSGWEHERGQPDADMLINLCDLYGIHDIGKFFDYPSNGTSVLTEDEARLLNVYRTFNTETRTMVINFVETLAGNPETQEVPTQSQEIS